MFCSGVYFRWMIGGDRLSSNYILLPLLVSTTLDMFGDFKVEAAMRAMGRVAKQHVGFLRRTIALLDVAADAGGDDVLPGVLPSARSRHYVVQCQIISAVATVLTRVPITVKNVSSG